MIRQLASQKAQSHRLGWYVVVEVHLQVVRKEKVAVSSQVQRLRSQVPAVVLSKAAVSATSMAVS